MLLLLAVVVRAARPVGPVRSLDSQRVVAARVARCSRRVGTRRAALALAAPAAVAVGARGATAAELDDICPGCGQAYDALPLASIRGRWALAATWRVGDGPARALDGVVSFRGLGDPNRGRCDFLSSDAVLRGKGSWVEKPARIVRGQFSWSARWKLQLSDGTAAERIPCPLVLRDDACRPTPAKVCVTTPAVQRRQKYRRRA